MLRYARVLVFLILCVTRRLGIYSRPMWKVRVFPHIWPIAMLTTANELQIQSALGCGQQLTAWCSLHVLIAQTALFISCRKLTSVKELCVGARMYDCHTNQFTATSTQFNVRAVIARHCCNLRCDIRMQGAIVKDWTVPCAACKGYSSFTPITVLSGPANRFKFAIHFLAWLAIFMTDSCGLTCLMFPWLKPQTLSIIGI